MGGAHDAPARTVDRSVSAQKIAQSDALQVGMQWNMNDFMDCIDHEEHLIAAGDAHSAAPAAVALPTLPSRRQLRRGTILLSSPLRRLTLSHRQLRRGIIRSRRLTPSRRQLRRGIACTVVHGPRRTGTPLTIGRRQLRRGIARTLRRLTLSCTVVHGPRRTGTPLTIGRRQLRRGIARTSRRLTLSHRQLRQGITCTVVHGWRTGTPLTSRRRPQMRDGRRSQRRI
jgi:hypothetical protein